MLEDNNFLDAAVYLAPLGDGTLSDEDSDMEEGCSANHLSSGQLTATAEFVINNGSDVVNSVDDESDEEQPDEPEAEETISDEVCGNHLFADCPPAVQYRWVSKDRK